MSEISEPIAPDLLVRRSVTELKRCIDILSRVEDGVIPLVSAPIAPSLRAALQDIDLLGQCIDDVARCLTGLAGNLDGLKQIDALPIMSTIKLQDMRIRLEGGSRDSRKLVQRQDMFVEF